MKLDGFEVPLNLRAVDSRSTFLYLFDHRSNSFPYFSVEHLLTQLGVNQLSLHLNIKAQSVSKKSFPTAESSVPGLLISDTEM